MRGIRVGDGLDRLVELSVLRGVEKLRDRLVAACEDGGGGKFVEVFVGAAGVDLEGVGEGGGGPTLSGVGAQQEQDFQLEHGVDVLGEEIDEGLGERDV